MTKKRSTKLQSLKRKAQKEGWASWIRTEADERAVLNGCYFDPAAGEIVADFFRTFLCHSKGQWAGKPFELLDWQMNDLIMPLFGWKRENGLRRFTRSYVEIPKKNGKSTLASGIGLYMLAGDGEMGAEVYSCATDKSQSSIVHGEAINMVDASPELSAALKINRSTNSILFGETKSFYRALTGEADSKEGLNAHCFLCDEMHVWRGRKLFDAIRYGMASRRQPLLFMITTAGNDLLSVCREQHLYAKQIANGDVHDERFFGYIRAAEPDDDWLDPETWEKANPSFGITINADEFAEDAKEASNSPASISSFKRYRLDLWGTGTNTWFKPDAWDACGVDFCEDDLAGWDCFAGLDLAKTQDTTSLQLFFPDEERDGGGWLLSYFFLPETTAERMNNLVPWKQWADAGYVTLTPGDVCDYAFVEKTIERLAAKFRIQTLYFDPHQAEKLTQDISESTGIPRVEFQQSMANYAEPTEEFERMVIADLIYHNSNPVMNWQIGNVVIKIDAEHRKKPLKPSHNDHRKVDGPQAAVMALAGWLRGGEDDGANVYEQRGMRIL